MKLYIAKQEDQRQGGGWSWIANAKKTMADVLVPYEEAEVYLIPSPSMVSKEEVDQAQADGKKIVLRVDNIVRNSRNRNTGMSRMKRFAEQADLVIYQSEFAKELLLPFIKVDGEVILNSCDRDVFNSSNRQSSDTKRYIYSRVNRDETKNWEMARFTYQNESETNEGNTILNIVGHYSPELIEYNFDFYQDEKYRYWGVIKDLNTLADIYRNSDYLIYTFWNDACSNTLIEALCSGCEVIDYYNMINTGGSAEIMYKFAKEGDEYFGLDRMGKEYKEAISVIL